MLFIFYIFVKYLNLPTLAYTLENLTVEKYASEGWCVTRIENKVHFIEFAAAGDVADILVFNDKKKFAQARIQNLISPSADRVEPLCPHFGVCGGCKWQHVNYSSQLKFKKQQVIDSLEKIAGVNPEDVLDTIASPKTQFYRNKLEFSFSNKQWLSEAQPKGADKEDSNVLGFHAPKRFDKVVDIDKCVLQPEPSNEIRNFIKDYALKKEFTFHDAKAQKGWLRNMILRCNEANDWMLIMIFSSESKEILPFLKAIANQFSVLNHILYVINNKANDTISDLDVISFKGEKFLTEKMEDLTFRIGPKSFYQTNSQQAYQLYKIVRNLADINPTQIVYDLYTGTGTIALFVAKQAQKVIGIDYVESSIADAKFNAEANHISNVSFFAGDMKKVLTNDFILANGKPDVIITDPARAGMDEQVVEKILEIAPLKLVYVSCNPSTQARDIALLKSKYKIEKIQPLDMFPHTYHVESVISLSLI